MLNGRTMRGFGQSRNAALRLARGSWQRGTALVPLHGLHALPPIAEWKRLRRVGLDYHVEIGRHHVQRAAPPSCLAGESRPG